MSPAWHTTRFALNGLVLAMVAMLPACHIGSGFDTAEKRRNLTWQEEAAFPATNEPATVEQKQSPPIVYLLVAG